MSSTLRYNVIIIIITTVGGVAHFSSFGNCQLL